MNILILVRILIWIWMLDHPTDWLGFENEPGAIALFQIIGHLHAGSRGRAGLRPEFNFGVRLIPIDGNTSKIHVHGAQIERAHAGEVLHDAGANGVVVVLLLLASTCSEERGGEPQSQSDTLHTELLSSYQG